jgi:hypothetical protein
VLSSGPAGASGPATGRALQLFKDWFWRPPRPHGETIVDRRVSPLELLYDLVYATVIAQAGNHLAAHVSANGLFEFAVVFSLTWIAWANGSLYLELHGRLDGRTRTYFFLQIGLSPSSPCTRLMPAAEAEASRSLTRHSWS